MSEVRVAVDIRQCQNMTSVACLACCLACSGNHMHFVGSQSWLSRRSAFCLLWRALQRQMRISATVGRLGGYCGISIICLMVRRAANFCDTAAVWLSTAKLRTWSAGLVRSLPVGRSASPQVRILPVPCQTRPLGQLFLPYAS